MNKSGQGIQISGSVTERYAAKVLFIFFSVGAAGMSFRSTRPLFIMMIPYVLLFSLTVCFLFHKSGWNLKTVLVFSIVAVLSWIIEYAGVSTGKIFGSYRYLSGLGLSAGGTPLIIGINWLLLVYCTAALTSGLKQVSLQLVSASLMMVIYDAVLEIAAPVLNMWKFENGIVPLKNYAVWFLMAFFFHSLFKLSGIRIENRVAGYVFILQFMFFLVIILFLSYTQ